MEKGNKIILILGILALATGIYLTCDDNAFKKKAVFTEGKVVYVLGSRYNIQYFTGDGTEQTLRRSQKTHGYHEGDIVSVWYRNDKPGKARLSDAGKGSKKLFITGAFCILLGVYPLFQKMREKKE